MDEKFRKLLEDMLIKNNIVKQTEEVLSEKVVYEPRPLSSSQIGKTSDGTLYMKQKVNDYLAQNGYPFTQEYVDMAAKMFPPQEEKPIERIVKKTIKHSPFESISDENFNQYMQYLILEQLSNITKTLHPKYEYTINTLCDNRNGSVNIHMLSNMINQYSALGWRLKSVFTNELGKISNSVSIGISSSETNSTVDQIVLIFERPIND